MRTRDEGFASATVPMRRGLVILVPTLRRSRQVATRRHRHRPSRLPRQMRSAEKPATLRDAAKVGTRMNNPLFSEGSPPILLPLAEHVTPRWAKTPAPFRSTTPNPPTEDMETSGMRSRSWTRQGAGARARGFPRPTAPAIRAGSSPPRTQPRETSPASWAWCRGRS